MVTIKKIAEVSGYSQATISRLFNGDTSLSISEETKKKIIATAIQLGYDRSKIKTTLEKIAVLFWLTEQRELQDSYFHQLRLSLEKYSKSNNMSVEFISDSSGLEAISKEVTGFIGVGSFTDQEILTLKNSNLSGVMLELNPHPELFDTVKPDTSQITILALKQFLASGLTKIGFIGGGFFNPDTKKEEADSREIAFRTFLQQQNLLEEKCRQPRNRLSNLLTTTKLIRRKIHFC